jgi:hypothetical protein
MALSSMGRGIYLARFRRNSEGVLRSKWYPPWLDKPSVRVGRAMDRLSRNRILTPKEVRDKAYALSVGVANGNASVVANASVHQWARSSGMYKGAPLIHPSDENSRGVFVALCTLEDYQHKHPKRTKVTHAEIKLYNQLLIAFSEVQRHVRT